MSTLIPVATRCPYSCEIEAVRATSNEDQKWTTTGTQTAVADVTLHDLAADWAWMDTHKGFRVGRRGRIEWEQAEYTDWRMRRVKVSRFAHANARQLRVVMAYLPPDTRVTMVPRPRPGTKMA